MSPCNDGGPTWEQTQEPHRVAAVLCGVLSMLEASGNFSPALDLVNWAEVGVSREWLLGWWVEHKRMDERRRDRERQTEVQRQLQRDALAALTPEQRAALGFKP